MHEKERHRIILSAVQEKPVVTVPELVELTDSSEATIRRDIAALHVQKKLRRVRGGEVRRLGLVLLRELLQPGDDLVAGLVDEREGALAGLVE